MRVGICAMGLAALVLPAAVEAATVLTGVLQPVNGWAVLASEGQSNPSSAIPAGKRVSVSLSIDQGVIAEVLSTLQYRWSYDIMPGDPHAAPFGNDIDGSEACSFNGAGPDGCFDTSNGDPAQTATPARMITNLVVGQNSLSYDLFRPAGFDRCDTPVLDSVCRSQWTIFNDFRFSIASHKPVAYALRFGDPTGVPEPANWAMLIAGFGCVGGVMRRMRGRRRTVRQAFHTAMGLA